MPPPKNTAIPQVSKWEEKEPTKSFYQMKTKKFFTLLSITKKLTK